jgi:hypothetical protein
MFAAEIRGKRLEAMRAHRHWQWHLDGVYVKINGAPPPVYAYDTTRAAALAEGRGLRSAWHLGWVGRTETSSHSSGSTR